MRDGGATVIAGGCSAAAQGGPYLTRMFAFFDCQAASLGAGGYQALAAPGSPVGVTITALLSLLIGYVGYRLILGWVPRLGDIISLTLFAAAALTLATSWAAFRPLVYDMIMVAPAQISASIASGSDLSGPGAGFVPRLQAADNLLAEMQVRGGGQPAQAEGQASYVPYDPARNAELLGAARSLYLGTVVGGHGVVRLLAGLLLALAPLFALFLPFPATRSLFAGWLRVLIGTGLGAIVVAIFAAVQLRLLEPWLAALVSARRSGLAVPSAPVELFVTCAIFAGLMVAGLVAAARAAYVMPAPPLPSVIGWVNARASRDMPVPLPSPSPRSAATDLAAPSRAANMAQAMDLAVRREAAGNAALVASRTSLNMRTSAAANSDAPAGPVQQSMAGPRSMRRASARARVRDRG